MTSAQKKPTVRSLQSLVLTGVQDGRQINGQGLPCTVVAVNNALVTVAFDVSGEFTLPQVTCPIAESLYVLLPIQVGDTGVVMPSSARLGGVTGLGSGLAPLATPANLGALVFVPVGNAAWTTLDPNAVIIQAPNGAVIRTFSNSSIVTIDEDTITLQQGSKTVVMTGDTVTITAPDTYVSDNLHVGGNLTVAGDINCDGDTSTVGALNSATLAVSGLAAVGSLTIGGHPYSAHIHTGGTLAGGHTGAVV